MQQLSFALAGNGRQEGASREHGPRRQEQKRESACKATSLRGVEMQTHRGAFPSCTASTPAFVCYSRPTGEERERTCMASAQLDTPKPHVNGQEIAKQKKQTGSTMRNPCGSPACPAKLARPGIVRRLFDGHEFISTVGVSFRGMNA